MIAAALGLALTACGKPAAEAQAGRQIKVEAFDPEIAKAPPGERLATMDPHPGEARVEPAALRGAIRRIADPAPAAQPSAPKATPAEPGGDQAGFRLTVPLCREAERANDPLAKTPECVQLIQAARDQAKACKQAFEAGDDKLVMSAACRQAAGFR
jgi:hypothetical protein